MNNVELELIPYHVSLETLIGLGFDNCEQYEKDDVFSVLRTQDKWENATFHFFRDDNTQIFEYQDDVCMDFDYNNLYFVEVAIGSLQHGAIGSVDQIYRLKEQEKLSKPVQYKNRRSGSKQLRYTWLTRPEFQDQRRLFWDTELYQVNPVETSIGTLSY